MKVHTADNLLSVYATSSLLTKLAIKIKNLMRLLHACYKHTLYVPQVAPECDSIRKSY